MDRSVWEAPPGPYNPAREMIMFIESLYEDDGTLPEFTTSTLPPYVRPHSLSSMPAAQEYDWDLRPNYSMWIENFPTSTMRVQSLPWALLNDAKAVVIARMNNRWTEFPRGLETLPKVHKKLMLAVKQRKRVTVVYDSLRLTICPVVYTTTHLYAIEFRDVGGVLSMRWLVFISSKISRVKISWDEVYMNKRELDLTTHNPVPEEKIQWFEKNAPYLSVYLPDVKKMESPPNSDEEMSE